MNYYISDLHLFHANCLKFDGRPFNCVEDMHDAIRASWNNKVTNGDMVFIVGDISYRGKNEDLIAFVSTLKGHKILIKGNHDDVSDYRYSQLFDEICDYKEIQDSVDGNNYRVVLSHYPIFSWKNMGRGAILIHGHTHDSAEDNFYQESLKIMTDKGLSSHIYKIPPKAINVGCMKPWMGYEPRTLKELLKWEN